jgi:GT2 family glycosyltransferase
VIDTTPHDRELRSALKFASDVQLIHAGSNIGYGRACNLGIEWALNNTSCDFFLVMNNDTIVRPETIGVLEAAMESHPRVGILAPRIACLHNPDLLWYGGGEIDWRRASAFTPGFNAAADAPLAMTERDVTFASGCALFVRRPIAVRLGGFDPRFFMYEEDVEFCLRALEDGFRIRYLPRSLVLHRAQGSSRENTSNREDFWSCKSPSLPFYAFHVMRNRMLNIRLHAHGWHRLVAVTFFPLMLLRRAIPFLIGGRADAIAAMFKGIADSLRAGDGTSFAYSSDDKLRRVPNEAAE